MADQDHTDDPNKHVVDFLRYYCASETPFDYAVMLKGPWGSGKTYLIKNFLAAREQQEAAKNFYVSLYGISSPRQIEDEFYRQLHPILASKGMKIAAGIAKAALKATLKIDVTGDGKENISFSHKRNEGHGEMLLAIPGKKGKETAEQPGERQSVLQKQPTNIILRARVL